MACCILLAHTTTKRTSETSPRQLDDADELLLRIKALHDWSVHADVLLRIKALHDWSVHADVLHGRDRISDAKILTYERHNGA